MSGTEATSVPGGGPDLFVRNSTGLVRDLTAFDAFNLVFSAVLIPVGITQVMGFTPQFWPHANMLVSFLIATPLVLTFGLVYLYFTMLMPRSGGDYVWLSRTRPPDGRIRRERLDDVRLHDVDLVQLHVHVADDGAGGGIRAAARTASS